MSKIDEQTITHRTAFIVSITATGRRRDVNDYSLKEFIRSKLMGEVKLYPQAKTKVDIYAVVEPRRPPIEERIQELEDDLARLRDEVRGYDD